VLVSAFAETNFASISQTKVETGDQRSAGIIFVGIRLELSRFVDSYQSVFPQSAICDHFNDLEFVEKGAELYPKS
jgi:hypothetical protein